MLITGAAGFIGSHFVKSMLGKYKGIKAISYDNLTYAGSIDNLDAAMDNPRHVFVKGDICDKEKLEQVYKHYEIDCVVHFAAESHVDNSIVSPDVFFQTNVMGTLALLETAKKFWLDEKGWDKNTCRFHHVSTDEVYGSLEVTDLPFNESTRYAPNSPYAASKASSDHVVRAYHQTYGLPTTISNCSNNFGPNQNLEKLIPSVIKSCLNNSPIRVYGNGKNIRDWLYVDDHCEAIDLVLQRANVGESYAIGADNEIENLQLIKKICRLMDEVYPAENPYAQLIAFVDDRKGHDKRYAIDVRKAQEVLGFNPSVAFDVNLKTTVLHYVEKFKSNTSSLSHVKGVL
jgi:dTDP-glucose 4,6-dehydratase